MDPNLKGKTALVTGSSQGIGKACAIALAKEGCNIILCARGLEKLAKTASEIKKIIGDRQFVGHGNVDATNREKVRNFMGNIRNLDILVNNVGGGTGKPLRLFDLTESDWLEMYKLNVLSMIWFTEFALPLLEKSSQARIINIGSAVSHQPGVNNPHYISDKAALDCLTKILATELAPKGICVNVVGPHALACENFERDIADRAQTRNISITEAREKMLSEVLPKIPMGRQGTNEDVANLVVYLASAQANFITGTYIPVDGGTLKTRP